jgi:hypothetical protein
MAASELPSSPRESGLREDPLVQRCRACGEEKQLIEAHIIPKSFFAYINDGDRVPGKLYSSENNVYPRRSPIGAYDSSILCRDCEDMFAPWDDYAAKLLLADPPGTVHARAGQRWYFIESYDYTMLKLFFLSVLWRASVSKHDMFELVHLGPYEDQILEMLTEGDPGPAELYAVLVKRLTDKVGVKSILSPHRLRFEERNFNLLHMAGYKVHIQVDRRPVPDFIRASVMSPSDPLIVYVGDSREDGDFAMMKSALMQSEALASMKKRQ